MESVNRSITTPVWDKSSSTRGSKFKPKRDINGIIQCRTAIDQESCVYADNVRKLRQHEYDNQALYTDKESEIAAQNERSEQDFIEYFKKITYTRHPNASKSIIVNWERVAVPSSLVPSSVYGQGSERCAPPSPRGLLCCSIPYDET